MYELKACIVCFSTDVKLNSMNCGHLRNKFNMISGLNTKSNSGMPDYLCYQCSAYVSSFIKFRDKCQRAYYALQEIVSRNNEIKKSNLSYFNRSLFDLMPPLSIMSIDKAHLETTKFQWNKYNRVSTDTVKLNVPILHCSTLTSDETFNLVTNFKTETDDVTNDIECKKMNTVTESSMVVENIDLNLIKDNSTTDAPLELDAEIEESFANDTFVSDNEQEDSIEFNNVNIEVKKDETEVDGSNLDEEYAMMIPISVKEAKAATEVYKLFSQGKFYCQICNKPYFSDKRLKSHMRMHDKHVSGNFHCGLCDFYYKTEFLLKTHMTEKHMYKYVCRKCPEVNFDRTSAKQHYICCHLQKGRNKDADWYESRPHWLNSKGGKRTKGIGTLKPVRKMKKMPSDFLIYSPIRHEEQYTLIQERQNSRNYKEARFKCHLCYRGFRELTTFEKHMKKHDPLISGPVQCDMCKLYFKDPRKLYKHMNITHLFKYSCQMCSYVCYNRGQAQMHYRWHKNVTYPCPHCQMEFTKSSTQLTHIRIKHPSMYICNLCGHSFVSQLGLYCHQKIAHTKQEIEKSSAIDIDKSDPLYCADCNIQFANVTAFDTHWGSSNRHTTINIPATKQIRTRSPNGGAVKTRGRPRRRGRSEIINNGVSTATQCEVCNTHLPNDVKARRHYETEHPDTDFLKRYMCDICGHTTRQYANLLVHMRTHTNEKPYGCPHCDRRFNMPSNRDRHLVVHTGEKRYQCQHCSRRFTQSSACKLHIQTVHLKIPYAPWNKKNRKKRKEQEIATTTAGSSILPQTPQKVSFDTQGDYLHAYISYNDDI